MGLSSLFRQKMKNDTLRMQLALKIGVSYNTIKSYINNPEKDELTKPKYLDILCEISGLDKSEILEV